MYVLESDGGTQEKILASTSSVTSKVDKELSSALQHEGRISVS